LSLQYHGSTVRDTFVTDGCSNPPDIGTGTTAGGVDMCIGTCTLPNEEYEGGGGTDGEEADDEVFDCGE
jgi:hypothetical protein